MINLKSAEHKTLLSIIIPTFNNASYITCCINSILRCESSLIEVIVVDDGSTDNTSNIVRAFGDNRIVYIRQDNHGVSAARNSGIQQASGDYIVFADSDDMYTLQGIEEIVKYLQNSDVKEQLIVFDFIVRKFKETGVYKEKPWYVDANYLLHTDDRVFETQKRLFESDYYNSPCNKIYDRELILKNGIDFPVSIKNGEDGVFNIRYCIACSDVKYIASSLYIYRVNISPINSARNVKKLEIMNAVSEVVKCKQQTIQSYYDGVKADILRQKMWGCARNQLFAYCRQLQKQYSRKEICEYIQADEALQECVNNIGVNIACTRDLIKSKLLRIYLQ